MLNVKSNMKAESPSIAPANAPTGDSFSSLGKRRCVRRPIRLPISSMMMTTTVIRRNRSQIGIAAMARTRMPERARTIKIGLWRRGGRLVDHDCNHARAMTLVAPATRW
jgi:hypothetical protein